MKELYTTKKTKYNLKSLEKDTEYFMNILDSLNFDKLIDSKDMPYIKKPNDKLPKKVNLKIINDLDIKSSTLFNEEEKKELNNNFIKDYEKRTGINLNDEIEKYKSLLLLLSITNGTIDLISTNPNLFNAYKNKYDIKTAYEEITLRVLIGNILDIKKSLNKLNTISNEMKDMLDKFYNILNNI